MCEYADFLARTGTRTYQNTQKSVPGLFLKLTSRTEKMVPVEIVTSMRTLASYMRARGLDVGPGSSPVTTDPLSLQFTGADGASRVAVFVNWSARRQIISDIEAVLGASDSTEFLFIVVLTSSNTTRVNVAPLCKKPCEVWRLSELQFDILQHSLNPPMRRLADDERDRVLAKYSMMADPSVAPVIRASDPVARALGLGDGDVVEIVRPSASVGTYLYYRMCVV